MIRVMFIDEECDLIEVLPALLNPNEIEMKGYSDIAEALVAFKEERFDAVLLDVMMPPPDDMDAAAVEYGDTTGVEVLRRLKQTKPEVPVVAFTVVTDPDTRASLRKAGIAEIILKPAEADEIGRRLLAVTGRQR